MGGPWAHGDQWAHGDAWEPLGTMGPQVIFAVSFFSPALHDESRVDVLGGLMPHAGPSGAPHLVSKVICVIDREVAIAGCSGTAYPKGRIDTRRLGLRNSQWLALLAVALASNVADRRPVACVFPRPTYVRRSRRRRIFERQAAMPHRRRRSNTSVL